MLATAIVLAHGAEPTLSGCIRALVDGGEAAEIIVVDNAAARAAVDEVRAMPGVRVLEPGRNLGYAQGCNYAAGHANGDVLVFVNSDAVVRPGAVSALVRRVADPRVGLASANVRLAEDPELINTVGNPVHFLMFSWVGGLGEPATAHRQCTEVASITGVTFAVRREVWEQLGGFEGSYEAYCEDVYLSMRAWQSGFRVMHEPDAVVVHHYEFDRNGRKFYLLERNRLMNLILLPERRTGRLVAAPALAVEAGVLVVAIRDGWAADKVRGWRWLMAHRSELAATRRDVQAARVVPDRQLVGMFRGPLDPPKGLGPAVPALVSRSLERYWGWAVGRL